MDGDDEFGFEDWDEDTYPCGCCTCCGCMCDDGDSDYDLEDGQ